MPAEHLSAAGARRHQRRQRPRRRLLRLLPQRRSATRIADLCSAGRRADGIGAAGGAQIAQGRPEARDTLSIVLVGTL
jgi:hypothetical protein